MIKKNKLSILVALFILYLSLTGSNTFSKVPMYNIPFVDKLVHFAMYFSLMAVIIYENRKTLKSPGYLFLAALIPFLFGVLIEILQTTLTISRSGSFLDAIADLAGILVSLILWLLIRPLIKENIR